MTERSDIDTGFRDPWDARDDVREPPPAPSEYMELADVCECGGHEWADAGGGLLVCMRCEPEKWASLGGMTPTTRDDVVNVLRLRGRALTASDIAAAMRIAEYQRDSRWLSLANAGQVRSALARLEKRGVVQRVPDTKPVEWRLT